MIMKNSGVKNSCMPRVDRHFSDQTQILTDFKKKGFGLNLLQYFAMVEENFEFMSSETHQNDGFWAKKLIQHFTNG